MSVYRFKVQFLQSKNPEGIAKVGLEKGKEVEKQHLLILNSDFATTKKFLNLF